MALKSETGRTKKSIEEASSLQESEQQRKRGEQVIKKESPGAEEAMIEKNVSVVPIEKKISFFIKVLGFLLIVATAIMFCSAIYFYNQYVSFKQEEILDLNDRLRIIRAVFSVLAGCFFAYSRAVLLEHY